MTPPLYSRGVGIHVTTTASGPAALDALAAAVRAMQGGDPLRPVAIVVPTNTAGVMARRALGRRGGFAAIDVLTPFRLAELLGAPALHAEGRRPVSTPVVDLAVRRVVHANPGLYAGVQHHQSTIVALRDLYRELRRAGAGSITALARTDRGSEPARVAAEVARLLRSGWYDEGDLLARAVERAAADLPARLRRVVVHVPQRLRPLEAELLAAIGEHGTVEVVLGLSGHPAADADIVALASTLAGGPFDRATRPSAVAAPLDVVSTTDADDEVRVAVRAIVDAARRGTPFDRIAVLYPAERPYGRLVEHHLAAAGVPWNGRPGTHVDERMAPRVLVDVLDLDRRGLRRSNLVTLLADVPARAADGAVVPTARWERVGRAAGVVRESDWRSHLERFAADARASDRWDADADADAAGDLLAFVEQWRAELGDPHADAPLGGMGRVVPALPRALVRAAPPRPAGRCRGPGVGADVAGARSPRPPRRDRAARDARRVPHHVRRRARRHPGAARAHRRRRPRQHAGRRRRSRRRPGHRPRGGRGVAPARPVQRSAARRPRTPPRRPRAVRRAHRPRPPPVPGRRHDDTRRRSSPCRAATCGPPRRDIRRAG